MFTTSSYNQPGAEQPYFVLSISDGVSVSSVPADASNVVSKSMTARYAVRSARLAKEVVMPAYLTISDLSDTLLGSLDKRTGT
jgi:hypothetical protein